MRERAGPWLSWLGLLSAGYTGKAGDTGGERAAVCATASCTGTALAAPGLHVTCVALRNAFRPVPCAAGTIRMGARPWTITGMHERAQAADTVCPAVCSVCGRAHRQRIGCKAVRRARSGATAGAGTGALDRGLNCRLRRRDACDVHSRCAPGVSAADGAPLGCMVLTAWPGVAIQVCTWRTRAADVRAPWCHKPTVLM